ncbi:hypothetical protein WA026_005258 [Henosepilachna vigintioctopunctata]|uniref:GH18 domain-containing protein n=1 Tax=Henosepilachna vigintioctopunctata TaxID=420089 RepID=A0AAW1UL47_9CUCU
MVAIQFDYLNDYSHSREVQKPRCNHTILVFFVIWLFATCAFVLYFSHNEEAIQVYLRGLKNEYASKRLVCYYNFPSTKDDLRPENIDAKLCTHIIVGFLKVNSSHELGVTKEQVEILNQLKFLKNKNVDVKVLISVGGAGNVKGWSRMVYNHTNRKRFIRSVRIFLENNILDGIDLDWEYPNDINIYPRERIHFTQLVEEFRMHINRNKYKFIVSVAVPYLPFIVDTSYQIYYLNKFADFINLMSYNYHYFSNLTPFTGLNSPLIRSPLDHGIFESLNINDTLIYYQQQGMDKNKINVGLPTFGHSFTLFNQYNNGLYAPSRGYGTVGNQGFASYSDILKFLQSENVLHNFDSATQSPYAVRKLEWVSFDNNDSLALKAKFIMDEGFGGVMMYSLNADDFSGILGKEFSLTRSVKNILVKYS